jgi:hypothetical protein
MSAFNCRLQGLPSSHGSKRAIRGTLSRTSWPPERAIRPA